ncbi:hypothetical protein BP6252_07364 [Coleophoma cylindrospora]|uniref:Zn(2)-C6 fungal-type domain-containing protein n=1 Tax=Coleophoma cylindrospora TaxID=1849047 RepID=A0A3D8RHE4_9HELO|nr:hypothetical protein BP6252_07364 [Coleophoma cylindrospora]
MPRVRTIEGSCWACKERRVICDLTHPTCNKCASSGRSCDYGRVRLKWTDCIASRGRLAGQKIPLDRPLMVRRNSDHHLMYFENELLPRFNLSNTIPRFSLASLAGDPLVLQSVIAIGAAHSSYRSASSDPATSLTKSQDRSSAIRIFRENLSGKQSEEVHNSLFMANVLLCMLDGIIDQQSTQDAATHHHILGGKAILNQWGGAPGILQTKNDLPVLMFSIFATMDLTHALLMGGQPFVESTSWVDFADAEPWWGNVKADNEFLAMMAILSQLATLGHSVHNLHEVVPIGTLLSIQKSLEHHATRTSHQAQDPSGLSWASFCTVYRCTAYVYLYRALSGLDIDHPLVQQAVTTAMEIVAGTLLTENLHHCLLFPLLTIGSHCMSEKQRQEIRRRLATSAQFLSFGSLRNLDDFLQRTWAKIDRDPNYLAASWWSLFDEIASATCLF